MPTIGRTARLTADRTLSEERSILAPRRRELPTRQGASLRCAPRRSRCSDRPYRVVQDCRPSVSSPIGGERVWVRSGRLSFFEVLEGRVRADSFFAPAEPYFLQRKKSVVSPRSVGPWRPRLPRRKALLSWRQKDGHLPLAIFSTISIHA